MEYKIKWTRLQIVLEILCTFFFLGFIIWLVVNWNTIPDRVPSQLHVMGKSLSDTSKKTFAIVPFQLVAFILYVILTPIEFVPSAWTNLSCSDKYTPPKAYQATRTFLILLKGTLLALFNGIIIAMIYPKTDPILTILVVVIMIIVILVYLLLLHQYRCQK